MSRIFWDTHLFLYLVEESGARADRARALREWMLERGDALLTSTLTLGELLARADGDAALGRRVEEAVQATATVLPFDRRAALRFAEIRRDGAIGPADAVQLACAAAAGVDLFVTGDERLSRARIPGIGFVQSLARAAPLTDPNVSRET